MNSCTGMHFLKFKNHCWENFKIKNSSVSSKYSLKFNITMKLDYIISNSKTVNDFLLWLALLISKKKVIPLVWNNGSITERHWKMNFLCRRTFENKTESHEQHFRIGLHQRKLHRKSFIARIRCFQSYFIALEKNFYRKTKINSWPKKDSCVLL